MSDRATRIGIAILSIVAAPFSGGGTLTTFFYTLGANILLGEAAAALKGNSRRTLRDAGIKAAAQGEDEPMKLVFGETRIGGNMLALGVSGTANKYFHYALAHSLTHAGGIESITDIWFDDRKVDDTEIDGSGNVTTGTFGSVALIKRYLGTDSQVYDNTLESALTYWGSTATGYGVAYTAIRCQHDGSESAAKTWRNRVPTLSALVRGIKCYDPRLDSTNGGSGTHRLNNVDTWEWTDNPALVVGTYLVMEKTDGGCGVDSSLVNWSVIAASASVCEESITVPDNLGGSTTRNRYTFNGVLDTGDSYMKNIQKVLDTMAGAITYSEGQYCVHAGDYTTPTITIDDNWLIGEPVYSTKRPVTELYNAVKATYIDPLANYNTLECRPFTNSTYETNDGGQFWKELDFTAGVQDRYQAQQLCQIWGRRSRHMKTLSMKLNTRGMALKVWDVVTVDISYPTAISDTFRVMDLKWSASDCSITATLVEENSDTYDVVLGDFTETIPKAQPGAVFATPTAPTSPSATPVVDGIIVKWTPPGASEYSECEVRRATTSGGSFSKIAEVRGSSYTDPITDGSTYYYKVRARSALKSDIYSAFSSEASATAKLVLDDIGGYGGNLCHPRYSTFSDFDFPPVVSFGATASRTTSVKHIGTHALSFISTTVSNADRVLLTPSSSTYNVYLPPGANVIFSVFGRCSTASDHLISLRLAYDDATFSALTDVQLGSSASFHRVWAEFTVPATATACYLMVYTNRGGISGRNVFIDGVQIEVSFGGSGVPGPYQNPAGLVGQSAIGANEGRLADQRSTLAIVSGNYTNGLVSVASGSGLLQGFDAGADATVRLKACTIQFGFGQVSYNQADSTGKNFSTTYHGYALDPGLAGGTVTLLTTTTKYIPQSDQDYVYFGQVATPANGGGPTDGSGSGVCVSADAWMDSDLQSRSASVGKIIDCWDAGVFCRVPIRDVFPSVRTACVRLTTDSGAALTCSVDTPITQPDGRSVLAANIIGGQVLAEQDDGSWQWEKVTREFVGEMEVTPISVGGISFAASDIRGGRRIITHNMAKPLV